MYNDEEFVTRYSVTSATSLLLIDVVSDKLRRTYIYINQHVTEHSPYVNVQLTLHFYATSRMQ